MANPILKGKGEHMVDTYNNPLYMGDEVVIPTGATRSAELVRGTLYRETEKTIFVKSLYPNRYGRYREASLLKELTRRVVKINK